MLRNTICILLCCIGLAAHAVEVPLSIMSDSEKAEAARADAIAGGERRAFYAALAKLAPEQARDIYRRFRDRSVTPYITSFTITREVQRAGHYEADIIYRLDDAKLKTLMEKQQGIYAGQTDATPQGEGLLVIPAYDTGEGLLLWERENIWRTALNPVALEVGQGALVMPFGDPRDISLLDNGVVITADKQVLTRLAQRYGTRNVVIALARSREVNDLQVVEVILRKAGAKQYDEVVTQYRAKRKDTTLAALLDRAARDISDKLMDSLKSFSLFGEKAADKVKPLVLRLEYENGAEYRRLLDELRVAPGLVTLDIGSVGLRSGEVTLLHKGEATLIARALRSRNITVDDSKAYWVVSY